MSEIDSGGTGNLSGAKEVFAHTHLLLSDETGQVWALSVRPDGQLQTAKWPDGEPLVQYEWTMSDSHPDIRDDA